MYSPDELIGDIGAYMGVIYAGLCVTAAYNFLAAVLRALGDSKSPLYFLDDLCGCQCGAGHSIYCEVSHGWKDVPMQR